jgi:tight adherence protein C
MSPQLPAMLLVGLGLYLVVTSLPFGEGRRPLIERLRRWDVDVLVSRRVTGHGGGRRLLPWPAADAVLRPLLEDLAEPVGRLLRSAGLVGSDLDGQLRLLRPGTTPSEFVERQLLLGAGAALGVATLAVSAGQSAGTVVALGLVAGGVGFVWPRTRLVGDERARRQRIQVELPQIVRLLAVGRSAGLGLDAAVERVASASVGPLGRGLHQARAQVAGGLHLMDALEGLAAREDLVDLTDVVSRLRATDEHGLPLVQALEDLASSAEECAANRLLERGEKGALKGLLPLGLLMVPVSVVVSVVPSLLIMLGQAGP